MVCDFVDRFGPMRGAELSRPLRALLVALAELAKGETLPLLRPTPRARGRPPAQATRRVALVNMAVVLELVPAKGITLPFLSYGGSSLLASLAAVGILLSISRRPDPWRWSDQRGRRGAADGAEPQRPGATKVRNARRLVPEPA